VTAAELVGSLAVRGGRLAVEGDRLRYHGPRRLLTDDLRAALDERRGELIAFLRKTIDQLSEEELEALGYRQTLPTEVLDQIVADEPADGGSGR
jgi:hypothetical protein